MFSTLEEYRRLVDENGGASPAVAVLSSAVRDAANGEEFARTVGERFGFQPHILTGDDEVASSTISFNLAPRSFAARSSDLM